MQCPNPDFNKPEHRWRMLQRSLVEAIADLLIFGGKVSCHYPLVTNVFLLETGHNFGLFVDIRFLIITSYGGTEIDISICLRFSEVRTCNF